jgi:hypothetical protein
MFRFSVAPGLIIPMPGPNFADEVKKLGTDDDITFSSMDKHVFAAGARFYFDYIVNRYLFVNVHNETIFYPVRQDLNRDSPNLAAAKLLIPAGVYAGLIAQGVPEANAQGLSGMVANDLANASGNINYQYRMTFEIEPVFTYPVADGINLSFGLPINYRYLPAPDISLSNVGESNGVVDVESLLRENLKVGAQHSLGINPNISMFLTRTPLPLEFKFQYGIPVYGQNTMARHNMMLQIRAYFRI